MDPIKKQSLDGMKPATNNDITPPKQPDVFNSEPANASTEDDFSHFDEPDEVPVQNQQPEQTPLSHENQIHVGKPKKKGKLKKLFVILITLLFIASAVAAAYFYNQTLEQQKKIDDLQSTVLRLQQENYSLRYDQQDAKNQTSADTSKYTDLLKKAQQLKETCGNGCAAIVIPAN
jgi:cell division protein FtsL